MYDQSRVVDLIEQANDARPFCPCGRHTTPVWRDGVVWLECSSISEPRDGVVARIVATATAPGHLKFPIIEIPGEALAA